MKKTFLLLYLLVFVFALIACSNGSEEYPNAVVEGDSSFVRVNGAIDILMDTRSGCYYLEEPNGHGAAITTVLYKWDEEKRMGVPDCDPARIQKGGTK
ncbi:hypothetical protein ACFYKX_10955 [Cytobacillus sp. FJAT-54145]|uniref:Uncharacterized protein n=1 Tax=Cytobacillus spartinae TaxID=3299023 RepID=A0ABW6KA93_9BACI